MNCSTLTGLSFITCAGQDLSGTKGIRVIEHGHAFAHATVDPGKVLEIRRRADDRGDQQY
jgi:hypothetical protein